MAPKDPVKTAAPSGASMPDYLKEAFLFRWNLLFFLGGLAGAAMTMEMSSVGGLAMRGIVRRRES